MKRIWKKLELYLEHYELNQAIASGCEVPTGIYVTPGGSVPVEFGCASSYPGNGHWHKTYALTDTNGNGKIDVEEWYDQYSTADNDNATGNGHYKNHTITATINGKEITEFTGLFTS